MLRLGLIVAAVVLVVDQFSKWWMMNFLADGNTVAVVPFFNLVRAWNTGVSFSMFNDRGVLGVVVLSLIAIAIIAALVVWLKNEPSKLLQASIGMIIGGALGNVIDRIRFGAVFDFLDVYVGTRHWPAFNVADSFICIGAALIIIHSIFTKDSKKKIGE